MGKTSVGEGFNWYFLIDVDEIAPRRIGILSQHCLHHVRHRVRSYVEVICMEERDDLSGCELNPLVQRVVNAAVFFRNELELAEYRARTSSVPSVETPSFTMYSTFGMFVPGHSRSPWRCNRDR